MVVKHEEYVAAEEAIDNLGSKLFLGKLSASDCYNFINTHGHTVTIALGRVVRETKGER